MDEKEVVVVVMGMTKEEETLMMKNMIERGDKPKLLVKSMSAWIVFIFGVYLYEMMTFMWDKELVRAILTAVPFLLVFLVHLLCLYWYMSYRINSFVANPQVTTIKQIAAIVVKNYLPCVTIYILVHCFVLYHISDEVTRKNEVKMVALFAVMCLLASYGMVCVGYTTITEELESYQMKQQSATAAAPIDQHQQHMTGGREDKEKLIGMVKHTSKCCAGRFFIYVGPMMFLMWHKDEVDKKHSHRVLLAAGLAVIPFLLMFLVNLFWLRLYALDSINKSFEFNPESGTTTRERIIASDAKKHFASTGINMGMHLFILYLISDEATRKNELLRLLLLVGLLLSLLYIEILAKFAYIRLLPTQHKSYGMMIKQHSAATPIDQRSTTAAANHASQ